MDWKCSFCLRMVRDIKKSIPCAICNSLIHRQCSRLQPWQSTNSLRILHEWSCSICRHQIFPFSTLDEKELLTLTFNSTYNCTCQLTDTSDYEQWGRLNLCKLDLKEHDYLFNNDIDNYARFRHDFDYYSTHAFHKLTDNTQLNKALSCSMLYTNIQSVQRNKENREVVLHNRDFDVIALSETWHTRTNNTLDDLSLSGYHTYNGIAGHSKSGGCGFL